LDIYRLRLSVISLYNQHKSRNSLCPGIVVGEGRKGQGMYVEVGIVVDILVGEDSIPVVVVVALLFGLGGILRMLVVVVWGDCILVGEGDSIRLYPSKQQLVENVRRGYVGFCVNLGD
jgi:hypothetical protein